MEPTIHQRFTDEMLDDLVSRYDVQRSDMKALDGFESFIYEMPHENGDLILRVSHSERRSEALIRGEVDWINYLADGGASVAKAVESQRGNLIEAIDDGTGEQFLATAFVKAAGKSYWESGATEAFYEMYGQMLGRIHALSKHYRPTDPLAYRPQWDDPLMLDIKIYLPATDGVIAQRFNEVVEHLHALPIDDKGYGLIHVDAHGGNILVDEDGTITLFDFDDCLYCWYICDIAIVLFYAATNQDDPAGFTHQFMPPFLRGYGRENALDPSWLAEIPWFLKQREIDLYAIIHRSFDVENLTDPWVSNFMAGRKEKIEQAIPFLKVDFNQFASLMKPDLETL